MEWHVLAELREWALLIFAVVQIAAVVIGWLVTRTLVSHEQLGPIHEKVNKLGERLGIVEAHMENAPDWEAISKAKERVNELDAKVVKVSEEVAEIRTGVAGLHTSQEQTRQDIRAYKDETRRDINHSTDQLRADMRVIQEHLLASKES